MTDKQKNQHERQAKYIQDKLKKICTFSIEVHASPDFDKAEVRIGCDKDSPPDGAILAMTEHLMTMFAMHSAVGFEEALTLLCEGARSNKPQVAEGKLVQ
jgi:hypothetical protein